MTESQTRPPTPAKLWVSPLIELSNGTLYPYWNLKNSGLGPYFDSVRRAFSSINPFAYQQVPTSQRAGLNIRFGRKFYRQQPYPSTTTVHHHGSVHYDPLVDPRLKGKPFAEHISLIPTIHMKAAVPRFCERQIRNYKRCVIANDNKEQVCKHEQENIIAICPRWSLNNLKEKKLGELKDQAYSNKKYKEVMEVAYYNKGRTVADVPLRSWEDGNVVNLRGNTMWADDRYADITEDEIKAAQERVKRRREAHPAKREQLPHYDRSYEAPPRQVPLYSL